MRKLAIGLIALGIAVGGVVGLPMYVDALDGDFSRVWSHLIPIGLLVGGVAFIVETTIRGFANVKNSYWRMATGVLMTVGGFAWLWFSATRGPALGVLTIACLILAVGEGLRAASRKNRRK